MSASPATLASGAFLSGQVGPAPPRPALVTLDKADAAKLAAAERAAVQVEMPAGVELKLWAPDGLIADPVALEVTPDGTVYVAGTQRNNLPLDIRGHQDWMTTAHTMKTVADLRRFYTDVMSPANSAKNGWIPDANGDGVKDIRDLAEFKERVYRVQDTDGDGIADTSQVVYEGFNDDPTWDTIGGVLTDEQGSDRGGAAGHLPAARRQGRRQVQPAQHHRRGHEHPPGVRRPRHLRRADGPRRTALLGGRRHRPQRHRRNGKTWAYPNQGAVMRSDPDGSNFEVFASGIRNLQEFSFDEHGNLISVDNDGDHPSEHERVVYLPWNSETGWRSTWQYGKYTDPKNNRYNVWMDEGMFKPRFDGRTAPTLPPIANWHAGPSGMAYNPGTALSDAWKNHFFVTSFVGSASTARIYAFKLKEKGAGFAMGPEQTLLQGHPRRRPAVRPRRRALPHRLDHRLGLEEQGPHLEARHAGDRQQRDPQGRAHAAQRRLREGRDAGDRRAARRTPTCASARRRSSTSCAAARARRCWPRPATRPAACARLHALWGLAQLARKDAAKAGVFAEFLTDQDGEIRAQAARMIGDVKAAALAPKVLPLLMDTAPRARFFAAEALGRTAYKPGGAAVVDMLADNDGHDVYLQHAGASRSPRSATPRRSRRCRRTRRRRCARRRSSRSAACSTPASRASSRTPTPAIATDAARAINDDGSIVGAVPALAATLTDTALTGEPFLRRAINANLRVGSREAVDRVAAFAADAKRPEPLRVEAVAHPRRVGRAVAARSRRRLLPGAVRGAAGVDDRARRRGGAGRRRAPDGGDAGRRRRQR